MRPMLIISLASLLAGCINQRSVLINDQGDRLTCEASGFGLAGSVMADNKYEACISEAKTRGYRLEEQKN